MTQKLLSRKELAAALSRSVRYVDAMKRAGFPMIAGRATPDEARQWLRANPGFRSYHLRTFAGICRPAN
jgi:phage terminase Nu1 subunit (DNA packaging protein)